MKSSWFNDFLEQETSCAQKQVPDNLFWTRCGKGNQIRSVGLKSRSVLQVGQRKTRRRSREYQRRERENKDKRNEGEMGCGMTISSKLSNARG